MTDLASSVKPSPIKPIIVWTLRRTGGTNLAARLFDRTGRKNVQHEPFNLGRQFGDTTKRWLEKADETALRKDVVAICSEHVNVKHCVEIIPWEITLRLLEASVANGYSHLFLYRRNAVDRLMSLHFAQVTGIWGPKLRPSSVSGDPTPSANSSSERAISEAPLPVQALVEQERAAIERLVAAWRRLSTIGVRASALAYEDVYRSPAFADAHDCLMSLLAHLGLAASPAEDEALVKSILSRGDQGTRDKYALIPGRRELEEALRSVPRFDPGDVELRGGGSSNRGRALSAGTKGPVDIGDRESPSMDLSTWRANAAQEMGFWVEWIENRGGKWPDDFKRRVSGDHPLPELVEQELERAGIPPEADVKIIDVGSGPLSYVAGRHDKFKVELTAVDPLANDYNALLDAEGIVPSVRVEEGFVETLGGAFPRDHYHVVWCCNALDHALDPVLGLFNLLLVCRPNGVVLLLFHPNEADGGRYGGLHQWNFDVVDGQFMIEQTGRKLNVSRLVESQCSISTRRFGAKKGGKERILVRLERMGPLNLTQLLSR